MIAHSLAVIKKPALRRLRQSRARGLTGRFHDATGDYHRDLPTPVKYYNPEIRTAYRQVEDMATDRLLSMLPEDLQPAYEPLLAPAEDEKELWRLVKAADKISALIKCIEERSMGNREFHQAELALQGVCGPPLLPGGRLFLEEFLPSYSLTLDEQE